MSYEKYHILDFCIEDEQLSNNDREVSVFVDTLGMTNIEFGNSFTIRTDYTGVNDLRDSLEMAIKQLDTILSDPRYEKTNDVMNRLTEDMNPATPVASAVTAPSLAANRSDQQAVDPFENLANDPNEW
jgi:hypothetical protein